MFIYNALWLPNNQIFATVYKLLDCGVLCIGFCLILAILTTHYRKGITTKHSAEALRLDDKILFSFCLHI